MTDSVVKQEKEDRRLVELKCWDNNFLPVDSSSDYFLDNETLLEIEKFVRANVIVSDSPSIEISQGKNVSKKLYCVSERYGLDLNYFGSLVKYILLSYRYIYKITFGCMLNSDGSFPNFRQITVRGIKHDSSQLHGNRNTMETKRNSPLLQDAYDVFLRWKKQEQKAIQKTLDDSDIEIVPSDSYGGLTASEYNVLLSLVDAWNFVKLETMHPSDKEEFMTSIHNCQKILGMRILRREHPNLWPTYSSVDGNSILKDE